VEKKFYGMKFAVVALAAGLFAWTGPVAAAELSAKGSTELGSADLLGTAVSADVLKSERGMSGLVVGTQEAEQNVINKISADGDLTLEAGMVMLDPGALVDSNMNMIGINTGQNAVMNFQFLVNVYMAGPGEP
jgi:hypothetical protein